jgi:D-alanyl-D-alanine carboxypeptidase
MTIHDKQWLFMQNVAKLIEYIDKYGYTSTFGEAFRTPEQAKLDADKGIGIIHSLHTERLAVDINLFKNGIYTGIEKDYEPIGMYWESLHPLNRWGGKFKRVDSDHFEMQDK